MLFVYIYVCGKHQQHVWHMIYMHKDLYFQESLVIVTASVLGHLVEDYI